MSAIVIDRGFHTIRAESLEDNKVILKVQSPFSDGKTAHTINMNFAEFVDRVKMWTNGMLVQNAFPSLTPSQRELLITGMTDDEFPKED